MGFQSGIFWGCIGSIFCWLFAWSGASTVIKKHQPYANRWMNKFAENIEVVVILPLIPPIIIYALFLRVTYYPIKRVVQRGIAHRQETRQELELRTTSGDERLLWAREDLSHVRREKMPLVEEVEVMGSDGAVQTVESALHTVGQKGFPFADLPAELRITIYSLLDYGTALRLSRVNKYFYQDRPFNSIDKDQRMTYIYYAEAFPHNKGRLVCYECLRVRSRGDYLVEHGSGAFNRFGERELDRRCFDCMIKADESIGGWRLWRFRLRRWELQTFHRSKPIEDV